MKTDSTTIEESVINMADDTRSSEGLSKPHAAVAEARRRLALVLDSARETCAQVQEKAIAGAKAADNVVREHPYHAMGIAAGLGALIGYLLLRRRRD